MRAGKIVGAVVAVLLIGGVAAALWYWQERGADRLVATKVATSTSVVESDSLLRLQSFALRDSLDVIDMNLRQAQFDDSEQAAAMVQKHNDLWARYTWTRARLSALSDSSQMAPLDSLAIPQDNTAGLSGMLGNLAMYLWILAGVSVVLVIGLAWFLLMRRTPQVPTRPLTEPTLTRSDRNVRMPVSRTEASGLSLPAREPTFTQLRRAQATDPTLVRPDSPRAAANRPAPTPPSVPPASATDIPAAAPLPRTGRHAWENTVSQPQPQMAPSEPTVVQDYVVSMAKRGRTPAEIARRLRIPQDQVDLILKLRRNS
jgi:hypothetical protein